MMLLVRFVKFELMLKLKMKLKMMLMLMLKLKMMLNEELPDGSVWLEVCCTAGRG